MVRGPLNQRFQEHTVDTNEFAANLSTLLNKLSKSIMTCCWPSDNDKAGCTRTSTRNGPAPHAGLDRRPAPSAPGSTWMRRSGPKHHVDGLRLLDRQGAGSPTGRPRQEEVQPKMKMTINTMHYLFDVRNASNSVPAAHVMGTKTEIGMKWWQGSWISMKYSNRPVPCLKPTWHMDFF